MQFQRANKSLEFVQIDIRMTSWDKKSLNVLRWIFQGHAAHLKDVLRLLNANIHPNLTLALKHRVVVEKL